MSLLFMGILQRNEALPPQWYTETFLRQAILAGELLRECEAVNPALLTARAQLGPASDYIDHLVPQQQPDQPSLHSGTARKLGDGSTNPLYYAADIMLANTKCLFRFGRRRQLLAVLKEHLLEEGLSSGFKDVLYFMISSDSSFEVSLASLTEGMRASLRAIAKIYRDQMGLPNDAEAWSMEWRERNPDRFIRFSFWLIEHQEERRLRSFDHALRAVVTSVLETLPDITSLDESVDYVLWFAIHGALGGPEPPTRAAFRGPRNLPFHVNYFVDLVDVRARGIDNVDVRLQALAVLLRRQLGVMNHGAELDIAWRRAHLHNVSKCRNSWPGLLDNLRVACAGHAVRQLCYRTCESDPDDTAFQLANAVVRCLVRSEHLQNYDVFDDDSDDLSRTAIDLLARLRRFFSLRAPLAQQSPRPFSSDWLATPSRRRCILHALREIRSGPGSPSTPFPALARPFYRPLITLFPRPTLEVGHARIDSRVVATLHWPRASRAHQGTTCKGRRPWPTSST